MRILLTEDEKSLSRAVSTLLKRNGYEVEQAYDGIEALEKLSTGTFDIMLLDVMMPRMDGMTVLKQVREGGNRIPVIMLTAKSDVTDKVSGLDLGADDYVTKPFAMDELLARVRRIVNRIDSKNDGNGDGGITRFGNISYERSTRRIWSDVGSLYLSEREGTLFDALAQANGNRVSSRRIAELFCQTSTFTNEPSDVDTHAFVRFIAKKMSFLDADCTVDGDGDSGYSLVMCDTAGNISATSDAAGE